MAVSVARGLGAGLMARKGGAEGAPIADRLGDNPGHYLAEGIPLSNFSYGIANSPVGTDGGQVDDKHTPMACGWNLDAA